MARGWLAPAACPFRGFHMQRLLAVATGLMTMIAGAVSPAFADKVDVSAVSCAQLVESVSSGSKNDKAGMGGILYWLAGYTATDEQGTVIDFTALGKDFDAILKTCSEQPKLGLLTVAKKHLGENATPQGSGAADLATMTCQAAVTTDKSDEDGLGFILMWIAGYHASDAEDHVFDTEDFVSNMQQVGEYCGKNPTIGLLTASDEVMGEDDSE